ncbi:MAG: glycosyltransferase family 2 protein [Bacillota bacterium]
MNNADVTAIIPAYNEADYITPVVKTLRSMEEICEVIVVNDGSTDCTADRARMAGAKVLDLHCNTGKAGALIAGVKAASTDIVVLIDADLLGLKPEHVRMLMEPVTEGGFDMSVGVFTNGRLRTDLAQRIIPSLSGQRALKKKLLLELEGQKEIRYGIDILLSRHARRMGYKIKHVNIPYVTQVMKEEKMGFIKGLAARLRMYWEILRALGK